MSQRRKLAAGNWKMNGLSADLAKLRQLIDTYPNPGCEVLVCPPATLLDRVRALTADKTIALGGQDCHFAVNGAHTGDISARMLADAGAEYIILGHSERRTAYGETDALVKSKSSAAIAAGLVAVICVGETLEQRKGGGTLEVIGEQIIGSVPEGASEDAIVIAYEPIWAIGTGRTPTLAQIAEVHDFIRAQLRMRDDGFAADGVRLLYGGSVKPSNAEEIFSVSNVDGALVGGASLDPTDFGAIVSALEAVA